MNLRQFKYILVLSETGSFSKAAEILNVSQPSLSQYVKYLENELNTLLFDRSGNELKLTDVGREYIETGKKILNLEHELQNKISDINNNSFGSITIGASLYRSTCLLPGIISQFSKKFPGINMILEEKLEKDLFEELDEGKVDFVVANGPVNNKRYIEQKICNEEMILCVPKHNDLIFNDNKLDLNSLSGKPMIVLNNNQFIQSQVNRLFEDNNIKQQKTIECRNIITQIAMVEEGIGYAIVPSIVDCRFLESKNICFYKIKQLTPIREIYIYYLKDHYLNNASKYLVSLISNLEGIK